MSLEEQISIINYMYTITNIPICVYQKGELIYQMPASIQFERQLEFYTHRLTESEIPVCYTGADFNSYFAKINPAGTDLSLVLGPYFTDAVTQDMLPAMMKQLTYDEDRSIYIKEFFLSSPCGPLDRFLSAISCIYVALFHEFIATDSIVFIDRFQKTSSQKDLSKRHDIAKTEKSLQQRDGVTAAQVQTNSKHTTYLHELRRMALISHGDVATIQRNSQTMLPGKRGKTSSDVLRNEKNIFIAGCTLYTRAAIAGGLDVEEAYNLSDSYIQTCESLHTITEVEQLHKEMPVEFAKRVQQSVSLNGLSEPIANAVKYIKKNIGQPISAPEVADFVGLSASYFVKRFKAETGKKFSEYLADEKIEQACMMLCYTTMTLTEISNELCFSSQSYFQNVFKKAKGVTPSQYRNQEISPIIMPKNNPDDHFLV